MNNFNYYNPARIIFDTNALDHIESLLQEYKVSSLLLIYSGEFIKDLGIWESVRCACENAGIQFYDEGRVVPNPKVELVRELIQESKIRQVDFILAVGGGSSIDTAKAVAAGIPYEGDVWDFFTYESIPETAIPVGVISTLPSSGSESSNCSIISNGLHKCGIEYDCIIPRFAIMNPQYTTTLPRYQTSCGLADIFSHMFERYVTTVEHVDTTDYMIEGAMKALLLNAQRLMENPNNLDARAEVQCLAFLAHNNLLDIGREADWASHRIEHEVSAQYGITHGEGMAVICIAWTKYMANVKPKKLAQLANRLFDVDPFAYTEFEMANILSTKLDDFFTSLCLKTTLTQLGITNEHFEEMANRATNNDTLTVGHYLALDKQKFIEILTLAL